MFFHTSDCFTCTTCRQGVQPVTNVDITSDNKICTLSVKHLSRILKGNTGWRKMQQNTTLTWIVHSYIKG